MGETTVGHVLIAVATC